MTTLITNGTVVGPTGAAPADVLVDGERIAALVEPGSTVLGSDLAASADTVIDQDLSGEAVDRQLAALEAAALARGGALGAGFAYPVTVERIDRWAAGLVGRGYQLAPVSAMMRR